MEKEKFSYSPKNEIVLGTIKKYQFPVLEPFVRSIRQVGFTGDVVLFCNDISQETQEKLVAHGAFLIPFEFDFPFLENYRFEKHFQKVPKTISVNCLRYFLYFAFLKKHENRINRVFLSDVRDVFFQKNPFELDFKVFTTFFEDSRMKINDCLWNSEWIKTSIGEIGLSEIGNQTICCSGISFGQTPQILDYLEKMTSFLLKTHAGGGLDQGIHNMLIHKGFLSPKKVFANEIGPVLTLNYRKGGTLSYDKEGRVLNDNHEPVYVLHQYDRHPDLLMKFAPALVKKLTKPQILKRWGRKFFEKLKGNSEKRGAKAC